MQFVVICSSWQILTCVDLLQYVIEEQITKPSWASKAKMQSCQKNKAKSQSKVQ